MNTKQQIRRVATVVFAVVVFAAYVYERSGGRLLEKLGAVEAKTPPAISPGLGKPSETKEKLLFGGSKSAGVFSPTELDLAQTESQVEPQAVPSSLVLLPGSKSAAMDDPEPFDLFGGSKTMILVDPTPQPTPQQAVPSQRPVANPAAASQKKSQP